MRNMLAFLAACLLTFCCVGYYMNWFQIRTTPATSGEKSFTVDINTKKIGADVLKLNEKVQERLAEKARDGADEPKKPATEPAAAQNAKTGTAAGAGTVKRIFE